MKTKQQTLDCLHDFFAQLQQTTEELKNNASKKHVHNFRVLVKQLKAYLICADFIQKSCPFDGDRKGILSLYKAAGSYRKGQVLHSALSTYEKQLGKNYEKIAKHLTKQQEKDRNHTINTLQTLEGQVFDQVQQYVTSSIEAAAPKKIMITWHEIQQDLHEEITHLVRQAVVSDEQLHTIRKHIKALLHLSTLFEEDITATTKKYSKLSKLLGLRNDQVDLKEFLADYHTKHDKKKVGKVIQHIHDETEDQKEHTIGKLIQFVKTTPL